jgi:C-terminal processing protease CtpA/Prc
MFNDLNDTKAIILDNRGYPLGTARDLANHLTNKTYIEAIISSLIVKSPDTENIIYDNYYQRSVPENKLQYAGEIVILVNEFTQSQAEFLCMVLQGASNKVKIIGSQTAGADGIVSWIILPGGISTLFTAQKVCYPNGNNTQGTGIIPDVYVTPTIEGIRNGNDEIYQTAISYLKNNLK